MDAVWPDTFVEEGNLALQVFHLRRELGHQSDGRSYIDTIPRRGYRFTAPVTEDGEALVPVTVRPRGVSPALWTGAALAVVLALLVANLWRDGTTRNERSTDELNVRALDAYVKARQSLNRLTAPGLAEAIGFFSEAIAARPEYGPAYAGLAKTYYMEGFRRLSGDGAWTRARTFAEKALALEESLDEAHYVLGRIELLHDWDWSDAEVSLRRALELNPGSAEARDAYSLLLAVTGRLEESLAQQQKAVELEPLSHLLVCNLGFRQYGARRYDEAIVQGRQSLEAFPNCPWEHLFIGDAYSQMGRLPEAVLAFEMSVATRSSERGLLGLAYAHALRGDRQAVGEALDRLPPRESVDPYLLAPISAALGDYDEAFALLERAIEGRSFFVPFLGVEPKFDPIRRDPRFSALLRRIGLPVIAPAPQH